MACRILPFPLTFSHLQDRFPIRLKYDFLYSYATCEKTSTIGRAWYSPSILYGERANSLKFLTLNCYVAALKCFHNILMFHLRRNSRHANRNV